MKVPSGLDDLRIATPRDLPRHRRAMEESQRVGFASYLPGLLASQRDGRRRILLGEDDGALCIYRWNLRDDAPRLDLLFPPLPFDSAVLKRGLQRLDDYNHDRRGRVLKVDADEVAQLEAGGRLRARPRKRQYLYAPAVYGDLAGNRFRTLRRNVRRVAALNGLETRRWTLADLPACGDLLARWRRHHRASHGTRGGVGTSRRVLELAAEFGAPDLHGEVILLDGRLVAFAFGGRIRGVHGAFLEARADPAIPGLSYFQRHRFLVALGELGLETVNDGPDVGRAGLAQLKNSLRPVAMHDEYRASRRR